MWVAVIIPARAVPRAAAPPPLRLPLKQLISLRSSCWRAGVIQAVSSRRVVVRRHFGGQVGQDADMIAPHASMRGARKRHQLSLSSRRRRVRRCWGSSRGGLLPPRTPCRSASRAKQYLFNIALPYIMFAAWGARPLAHAASKSYLPRDAAEGAGGRRRTNGLREPKNATGESESHFSRSESAESVSMMIVHRVGWSSSTAISSSSYNEYGLRRVAGE